MCEITDSYARAESRKCARVKHAHEGFHYATENSQSLRSSQRKALSHQPLEARPLLAVSAYFVYCNGDLKRGSFEGCLHFSIKVMPYEANAGWIDAVVGRMHATLQSDRIPAPSEERELCDYRSSAAEVEGRSVASVL